MDYHTSFKSVMNERRILQELQSDPHTENEIKNVINVVCNINHMDLGEDRNFDYIKDQVKKYLECKPLKDVVNTLGNFNFV